MGVIGDDRRRRDRRPRRRLRAVHGAGRDGSRRACSTTSAGCSAAARTSCPPRSTALIYPSAAGPRGRRPPRGGVRRRRHVLPRHRHRAGLGGRGAAADDVGVLDRIESMLVQELMDYSTYDSCDMMFDIMGFGQPPDADVPMADDEPRRRRRSRAPIMLLADGLGVEIEEFRYRRRSPSPRRPPSRSAGRIEVGHGVGAAVRLLRPRRRAAGDHHRAHHPAGRRPGARLADRSRAGG